MAMAIACCIQRFLSDAALMSYMQLKAGAVSQCISKSVMNAHKTANFDQIAEEHNITFKIIRYCREGNGL